MTQADLKKLRVLLQRFLRHDYGNMHYYNAGYWSRKNIGDIICDLRLLEEAA